MSTPHPFHVMTKPIGPRCNIDCSYCYYLEKEKLYPGEKKFRMSDAVLETYVKGLIAAGVEAGMDTVSFAWQGGEPTMLGLDFFERAVALQKRHAPPGVRIENTLQTNGILVDDAWAGFFAREDFLIGLSVDGPAHVHDRYRRDRAGRPTFAAVMRGLEALRRADVAFNILATVHRANAGKGREIYRFLSGLGSAHLQFIPIVERPGPDGLAGAPGAPGGEGDPAAATAATGPATGPVTDWSVAPRAYGKFLCDVFDQWYRRDIGRVFVQFFETQLGLWSGRPASLCIFAETCGAALAMEHNGDLYACDHYVYPEFRLGNIMQDDLDAMAWSEAAEAFGTAKRDSLTAQCRACGFRSVCNGGCPKHRFIRSRDGEPGHNYFCESYTMFFRHAGPRLRELALRFG